MFGLFIPPSEARLKREAELRDLRVERCVDFDLKTTKWEEELNLKASSWIDYKLAPLIPVNGRPGKTSSHKHQILESPSGSYIYIHMTFPGRETLRTMYGSKRGNVLFDGPVVVPALFARNPHHHDRFRESPWMSITPMEVLSLRCGERFAKGHTIIAGLGLGWQLVRVSHRKQVKKITLIEKDAELVDWLLPLIRPHMNQQMELDIVIDDAEKALPKMAANAALLDIYPSYGSNSFRRECPKIDKIWVWGSAEVPDLGYW